MTGHLPVACFFKHFIMCQSFTRIIYFPQTFYLTIAREMSISSFYSSEGVFWEQVRAVFSPNWTCVSAALTPGGSTSLFLSHCSFVDQKKTLT